MDQEWYGQTKFPLNKVFCFGDGVGIEASSAPSCTTNALGAHEAYDLITIGRSWFSSLGLRETTRTGFTEAKVFFYQNS